MYHNSDINNSLNKVSMNGFFITVEGTEGSGKTSLIRAIEEHFIQIKKPYVLTREPGDSELGRQLRPILLGLSQNLCMEAELFLFLADRTQHVQDIIKPNLEASKAVICDRYTDSTIAYQGYGRGMDLQRLEILNDIATKNINPNLTFLLDLPVNIGLTRARKRNTDLQNEEAEGRFEAEEINFHEKVRQGFLVLAVQEPHRFHILDATQSMEVVAAQAVKVLKGMRI